MQGKLAKVRVFLCKIQISKPFFDIFNIFLAVEIYKNNLWIVQMMKLSNGSSRLAKNMISGGQKALVY